MLFLCHPCRHVNTVLLIATYIGYLQCKLISSEYGRESLSKHWKTCPNSWKYIYGNWEICSDTITRQNCFMKTEYYPLEKNIFRIFIDITTTHPKSCKKDIECSFDIEISYRINDSSDDLKYQLLGNFTASSKKYSYTKSKKQLSIDLIKPYKGLYLALQLKQGNCASITELKLSYKQCSIISKDYLTVFPIQNAPSSLSEEIINGKCAENAARIDNQLLLQTCYSNGSIEYNGSCHCEPAYEKKNFICQLCPLGKYKGYAGNNQCRDCGANTFQNGSERRVCKCLENHFRVSTEEKDYSKDCHMVDVIRGFTYSNNTDSSVVITWRPTFDHINNPEYYIVKLNNKLYQRNRNRRIFFQSLNITQSFNIEIQAEATVAGRRYSGPNYINSFLVHENKYLSSAKQTAPSIFSLILTCIGFHVFGKI